MTLHEPAVTLTDYLLTLECGLFAALLARGGAARIGTVRFAFVVFFAAAAAAALFGGTVHGFFPDEVSLGNRALWVATMLSVGLTALAALIAGARLTASPQRSAKITPVFVLLYLGYAVTVIFFRREFIVAIAFYAPATVFLLGGFAWIWAKAGNPGGPWGVVGLLLTFVAAAVQVQQIALHPVFFDHNALYHLIQAIAMYLLFRAALVVGEGEPA